MKLFIPLVIALVLVTPTVAVYAQQDDLTAVPRISLSDLKELAKSGNVLVVDVRSTDAYKAGHIPGAVCLPLAELANRWKQLPADKTIITYCS
ncbi:MAG: rhodanese-like domain-containing protein [Acidobacteria bacterium]|nr:rhodanese-like domain-containing protein [Acidobacteriota bacterium]